MDSLNSTPVASRYTIGIFGRRNAGKSSLINALTAQKIAVTSEIAGTTTDPVYKTMEILPIGPVVFVDTAGLDDVGELGMLRIEKTYEVLRKCDFAIVVTDEKGISELECEFIEQLNGRKIPFVLAVNKCDKGTEDKNIPINIKHVCVSAETGVGIDELKKRIIDNSSYEDFQPTLVDGLINAGETAVLVTPIDSAAPKGRLILPQQQTVRDILDKDAMVVVTKEGDLKRALENLKNPPAIVITDSQAFESVSADTPEDIPLTSFSILFARQKSNLAEMVRGIERIKRLKAGDKVLIVEGCTHHRQKDDIGTVKIPRWIRQIAGDGIQLEWSSGAYYPKDINQYDVILHCGGCMINNREMQYRVEKAREMGVFITNYGVLIAHVMGILPRALKPFAKEISVTDA